VTTEASEDATDLTLRDAYSRVASAERALREFGGADMLTLSEADAHRLHALRAEERDARRALAGIEERIAERRLEFHE
jgi:hypothetical protein